jgi:uncharacterized protein (DUF608 family)
MGYFLIICGVCGLFAALSGSEAAQLPKTVFMALMFGLFGVYSLWRGRRQAMLRAAWQLHGQDMPAALFAYTIKEEATRTKQSISAVLKKMGV